VFIITFLSTIIVTYSQAPAIKWQKSLGGNQYDAPYCVIQTADGGYIVAGETSSTDGDVTGIHTTSYGGAFADIWVVKLSNNGSIEWKKCFGGSSNDRAYSMAQTTDGGYVIAGETWSVDGDATGNNNGISAWLLKIDGTGNLLWQKTYGGYGVDVFNCIRLTTDGGFIVAGTTDSNDGDVKNIHGGTEYWVLKLDAAGNIQWNKCYGGNRQDGATCIQQTTDGGYIVCGTNTSSTGDVTGYSDEYAYGGTQAARYVPDAWIIKLSSAGILKWQHVYGSSGYEEANSIVQANDGGYVFTGYTTSNNSSGGIWNVKLSNTGGMIWQKNFGGDLTLQKGFCIYKTKDGGYIIGAEAVPNPLKSANNLSCNNDGLQDAWFVKTDADGNLTWQQTYGSNGNDFRPSVQETSDGGYIASVIAAEPNGDIIGSNYRNFWVIKLSDAPVNPNVTITTSADTICPSATVTFAASGTFGGPNPIYKWKKNGVNVGTNSPVFSTAGLNNHDTIYCLFTSSGCSGASDRTATSNKVLMTIIDVIQPSLKLLPSANPICAGSFVNFTSNALNAGSSPVYQWKLNGKVILGINGKSYGTSALSNKDTIACTIPQIGNTCYNLVADTIIMVINDTLTPKINISAATDTICAGATTTFHANATNTGTAAVYTWLLNNLVVGGNNNTFSSAALNNNDTIICRLTSNATCVTTPGAQSNRRIIKVTQPIQISVLPFNNNVCSGSDVVIKALPVNAITSTRYQWQRNGVNTGTGSASLNLNNITTSDSGSYIIIATNGACGDVQSLHIDLKVRPLSASYTKANICEGDNFLFAGTSYKTPGKYQLHLINSAGCDSIATLDLTVNKTVTIQPITDIVTVANVPVKLSATASGANLSYLWQPALYLNNTNVSDPVSIPAKDIQYKLLVSDGACEDSAFVEIKVLPALTVPNAFSPNGDGINDTWDIKGISSYNGVKLTIYNRYGSIVFFSNSYKAPWKGNNNNDDSLPVGVYYYVIQFIGSSKQLNGSVTLLR